MTEKAEIMDEKAVSRAIARISYEIIERNKGLSDICIVGVLRRGAVLAKRVAEKLTEVEGKVLPVGTLDISHHRDDRKANEPDKSKIDFPIENKKIILVDDVIYTGRSVRAAIDAIMERGRPHSIQLAALIDRGHRELPIRADYVGKNVPTSAAEIVKVMVMEYDGVNKVIIGE